MSAAHPQVQDAGNHRKVTIYVGGVHASAVPVEIRTLLGSCIAVCLYDPVKQVGGMNHFLLPDAIDGNVSGDPLRFGVYSMDCLIGELMMLGADRRRMVAKVFGGGHVLGMKENDDSVPQRNIRFVHEFLQSDGFPIVSEDVGGKQPRVVVFNTGDGKAKVKRLSSATATERVTQAETVKKVEPQKFGDVTLF